MFNEFKNVFFLKDDYIVFFIYEKHRMQTKTIYYSKISSGSFESLN